MRLEHRLGIERLEALEQRRPQKGDKARRDDELGKPGELVGGQLAPRHRPLGGGAQQRHAARHHLAVIELGELREAPGFRDDEADDLLAPGGEDLAAHAGKEAAHDGLEGKVERRRLGARRLDRGADAGADQRLKQRLLRGEVQVDGALGDARPCRHLLEPRRREAALGENVERGVEDRPLLGLTLGIAADAPGRRRRRARARWGGALASLSRSVHPAPRQS